MLTECWNGTSVHSQENPCFSLYYTRKCHHTIQIIEACGLLNTHNSRLVFIHFQFQKFRQNINAELGILLLSLFHVRKIKKKFCGMCYIIDFFFFVHSRTSFTTLIITYRLSNKPHKKRPIYATLQHTFIAASWLHPKYSCIKDCLSVSSLSRLCWIANFDLSVCSTKAANWF